MFKNSQSKLLVTIAAITILFGSLSGVIGGLISYHIASNRSDQSTLSRVINQDVEIVNEQSALIDVAEMASKSVVSIVVTQDMPIFRRMELDPSDPFGFFRSPQREQVGTEEREVGAGTGFIVSEDGLIITNRHVVNLEDASYTIVMNDGNEYKAEVLERDTFLDIAFLKVDSEEKFQALNLGSSSDLKPGQKVIAIGNSLGRFSNTVTTGIVSGLSRDIQPDGSEFAMEDVIQTDAAINPGNSGGPLLDIMGNVIGVNVAVARAENIGFAIKIDVVKDLLRRFEETGSIERPILGVRYRLITPEFAESEDLLVDYGALIVGSNRASEQGIIPDSPADKAGLKLDDIILEIDGERIDESNSLYKIIQNKFIGDQINLLVLREGKEININVKLDSSNI